MSVEILSTAAQPYEIWRGLQLVNKNAVHNTRYICQGIEVQKISNDKSDLQGHC